MGTSFVRLIDQHQQVVASAQVAEREGRFAGRIDVRSMPAALRQRFEEYEEIVGGQMFSLLDDIEGQISAVSLKAVFEDGCEAPVEDLQIYPSTKRVSFRIAKKPAQGAVPA